MLFEVLSSAREETQEAGTPSSRTSGPSSNAAPDPRFPARSELVTVNHAHHLAILEAAWDAVIKGGLAMSMWPLTWPNTQITSSNNHAYLTAVNSLVRWLLPFTHSNSILWLKLKRTSRKLATCNRIHLTLQPLLLHLNRMTFLKGDAIHTAALLLPPEFLSHVCCLMCEGLHFGNVPGSGVLDMDRPGTFETSVLGVATALGRCHASHSKEGSRRGPCQPLLCHAALELARLALVICSKADTRSYDESDTMNMRIFVTFSQSLLFQPRSNCSSVRSDRSAGTLNGGASSAPVSQELVPRMLTSDQELICALRVCTLPWTREFREGMKVMYAVINDWESQIGVGAVLVERLASVGAVLYHLTKHVRTWMLLKRQERQRGQLKVVTPLHEEAMTQMRMVMLALVTHVLMMRKGEWGRARRVEMQSSLKIHLCEFVNSECSVGQGVCCM